MSPRYPSARRTNDKIGAMVAVPGAEQLLCSTGFVSSSDGSILQLDDYSHNALCMALGALELLTQNADPNAGARATPGDAGASSSAAAFSGNTTAAVGRPMTSSPSTIPGEPEAGRHPTAHADVPCLSPAAANTPLTSEPQMGSTFEPGAGASPVQVGAESAPQQLGMSPAQWKAEMKERKTVLVAGVPVHGGAVRNTADVDGQACGASKAEVGDPFNGRNTKVCCRLRLIQDAVVAFPVELRSGMPRTMLPGCMPLI
jgi:hypothetical protein